MVGDAKMLEVMKLSDDACAQELIHTPGSIQPHGLLVGLDRQSLRLITKSANFDRFLHPTPFGEIPPWLPSPVIELCRDLRENGRAERTVSAEIVGIGAVEVHCFVGAGVTFCEFETTSDTPVYPPPDGTALMVTEAIKGMDGAVDIAGLSEIAAEAVRAISGFERVLVYRFDADGHGDVPGESKVNDWKQSFLGLRFPSSDIPAQARELYRVTSDRWIPCRDYEPVPLMPDLDPMGQPFNLAFSHYRSVSPIHRLYQKNISVDGSMSVSILRGGVLWGLVIGHHRFPHRISMDSHHHVTAIVRAFAIRLDAILNRESENELERDTQACSAMLRKLAAAEDFLPSLMEGEPNIIGLLPECTGGAVVWDDCGVTKVRSLGDVPPIDDICALTVWVRAVARSPIFATDHLAEQFPPFLAHQEIASGVLACLFEDSRNPVLLLFRAEITLSVAWAGKPKKVVGANGAPNLPRRSFDRWTEIKRGHSQPWRPSELDIALTMCATINDVIVRQTRRVHDLNIAMKRWKQASESSRLLLQYASDAIHIVDAHGNIAEVSDSFCRMLGYTRAEAIGMQVAEWNANIAPAEVAEKMVQFLEQRQALTFETQFRRKNSSLLDVEVSLCAIELDGQPFIHCSARDITERKRAEDALRESKLAAESADRAKSAFLANMSHEIRNPMHGIIGLSHLLQGDPLDAKARKRVDAIAGSAKRLLGILNDILDISRIEAGKMTIERVPFSVERLIEDVLAVVRPAAESKQLVLSVRVAPEAPRHLIGDPLRIGQMLLNLINNAIKFTERGSVTIAFDVPKRPRDDGLVMTFSVTDTGVGLKPEQQERIFESFEQADDSTTRRFGGTGLGLAIVRQLAELMGGRVFVESAYGEGSNFWFFLPLGIPVDRAEEGSVKQTVDAIEPELLRGTEILLVEDDMVNRMVAIGLLESAGMNVDVALNGSEAVAMVQRKDYEIVLMDLQMPVMDGLTATRKIRDDLKLEELPIIAMTAAVMASDRDKYLKGGMNDFIGKPYLPEQLYAIIQKWVTGVGGSALFGSRTQARFDGENLKLPSNIAGLDIRAGLRRVAGMKGLYVKTLRRFLDDQGQVTEQLRQLIADGDIKTAHRIAHTLKGAAGMIEAREVGDLASKVESALAANDAAGAEKLLPHLGDRMLPLLKAIQSMTIDVEETPIGELTNG